MFLAQLSGSSTDTLEELSRPLLTPFALTFSGISTTTLSGGNSSLQTLATGTDGSGEFPTSGNNYVAVDANAAALVITFSSPVTSFGFYGTDVGDFASNHLTVTFTGSGAPVAEVVNNSLTTGRGSLADGSVLFFGYINTANPFTSVQIVSPGITSPMESFGFDDPVIGIARTSAAPEPGYFGVLAIGIVAISLRKIKSLKPRA